ncbi:MAG: hypothetical protein ACD_79C00638G0002 [uncultured bacterium]|nr:MAG: hypothetical protein ACD_79C00638G0002 [uncultured bacterium]
MKIIVYYKTDAGNSPVEDWLLSLQTKQFEKCIWVLRLIEELDRVPGEYFQKMENTEDIWEVRIQFGNNIFRILSFFDGQKLIILTHGFTKKTQKTPRKEIELAQQRKKDYFRRQKI